MGDKITENVVVQIKTELNLKKKQVSNVILSMGLEKCCICHFKNKAGDCHKLYCQDFNFFEISDDAVENFNKLINEV